MSHNIENGMIAWKGETPWHGLGTKVNADMTGADMLKVAKLDWHVQRRSLAMREADGTGLITEPLAKLKAITRMDTNQVFQIATDRYHPIQNEQIVDFFREYCEAGHATMETVGGLNGGSKIWALARLNGGSTANLQGVDELRGYMLLATSHDGSLRTIGKPTQTRVVCWNTLSAAIGENSKGANEFRMKHSRKFTPQVALEAKKIMGIAIESIQRTNETADRLSRVTVDSQGRYEFVKRLLSGESLLDQITSDASLTGADILSRIVNDQSEPADVTQTRVGRAILDAIVDSPGSDLVTATNTLWGCVNGVTYYTDHVRGRSQDTRLSNSWFGTGDTLKSQAVNVALQMAGQ